MLKSQGLALFAVQPRGDDASAFVIESPSLIDSVVPLPFAVREFQVNYPLALFFSQNQAHMYRIDNYSELSSEYTVDRAPGALYFMNGSYIKEAPPGCRQVSYFGQGQHSMLFDTYAQVGAARYDGDYEAVVQDFVLNRIPAKLQIYHDGALVLELDAPEDSKIFTCGNGVAVLHKQRITVCKLPALTLEAFSDVRDDILDVCFTQFKTVCRTPGGFAELIRRAEEVQYCPASSVASTARSAIALQNSGQGSLMSAQQLDRAYRKLRK